MSNLALDLRPQNIGQVIGQDATKRAIESFAKRGNWPNVFLFYGPPGTGKTTLAEIVAQMVGADASCVHNINGSVQNKVEDARALAEMAESVPFVGTRRVFILNEFHRFTDAAQDALKDPMEKTPALWVLTTDAPDKISPAILSRAKPATFKLNLLSDAEITKLVVKAVAGELSGNDGAELNKFLIDHNVRAPREILGVIDQRLAGVPLDQALHGAAHEPLYRDVAGAVLRGDWTKASAALNQIKTADARGMIGITSAFLRGELLKNPIGPRADAIAACLVGLDQTGFADGPAYGAVTGLLYKTCRVLARSDAKS